MRQVRWQVVPIQVFPTKSKMYIIFILFIVFFLFFFVVVVVVVVEA